MRFLCNVVRILAWHRRCITQGSIDGQVYSDKTAPMDTIPLRGDHVRRLDEEAEPLDSGEGLCILIRPGARC